MPQNSVILQAVILTGGYSRRMGKDKSLLDIEGRPMYQKIIDALWTAGIEEIYISCRPEQINFYPKMNLIQDNRDSIGPLTGIFSAFEALQKDHLLIVACDNPEPEVNVLISHYSLHPGELFYRTDQNQVIQPFPGIYSRELVQRIELNFDSPEFSLFRYLNSQEGLCTLPYPESGYFNLNFPLDLEVYLSERKKT